MKIHQRPNREKKERNGEKRERNDEGKRAMGQVPVETMMRPDSGLMVAEEGKEAEDGEVVVVCCGYY